MTTESNNKPASAISFLITMTAMIILFSVMSVSVLASPPGLTWNNPSINGTYYWQNFTLNVTTDINANCTYQVNYLNTTIIIPLANFTNGQNTTNHTTNIDVDSLPTANNFVLTVNCFNSANPLEFTNESKWFQRDPDCGDWVNNSWVLGHDMNCAAGIILSPNVIFDCNSHIMTGNSGSTEITVYGDNITVTNCNLSNFGEGIAINSPFDNILITNSTFHPAYDGIAIRPQDDFNLTITNNLFDLSTDATGILLDGINFSLIQHNNFLPGTNNNNFPLADKGLNDNVLLNNNYWGHSSCSLFTYLVDTNSSTLTDNHPVSQQDNWTSYINCSDQNLFEGFNSTTIYDGDGSTILDNIQGYDYYYDDNNTKQNITNLLINGVYPWRIYSTYYYPGDQIVFDVNITPANFKFIQFGIEGNSFQSYNLSVTNLTSVNETAGVYRVNISDYVFNNSNEDVNGSLIPRVMNFFFRTTDAQGATRLLWINALYNFTVQDALSSLGGNTTNWSNIPDMGNVSGLIFDLPGQGKIEFNANVDLTDPSFVSALRNLATLIELNNGTIGLDSSELAALNVSANITFYNVSGVTGLNTSTLNTSYLNNKLLVDGEICNTSVCTATNYSNITDAFIVSVAHWTTYTIDVTPPVISGASPSGSLSSSTTSVTLQVTTDELANCKYGTTDTSYSSLTNIFDTTGALTHQETYAVSSGNSYTFYVRCQDFANNTDTASTTISFSVDSYSSGGSSGGGSYTTSNLLTTYEKTVQIGEGGFYYFTTAVGGNNYKLELTSLTDTEATFRVNGKTATLKEGESIELDVDGNGVKDTYLKINTLGDYSVSLGIKKASTTTSSTTTSEESTGSSSESQSSENQAVTTSEETIDNANAVNSTENTTAKTTTEEQSSTNEAEAKNSSHWLIWTILLILFVIIVIVFVAKNTKIETS